MGKRNRLISLVLAALMFFSVPLRAMSAGEVVFQFVTSSFLGNMFSSFTDAGEAIKNTASSIIPVPDIGEMLKKLEVAALILKVLKAIGFTDDMDIGKFLQLIQKFIKTGDTTAQIAEELGKIAQSLSSGAGAEPVINAGHEALLGLINDNAGLNIGGNVLPGLGGAPGFITTAGSSLNLSVTMSLDSAYAGLGLSSSGTDDYGEASTGTVIELVMKFLKLLVDNADFIQQAGAAAGSLQNISDPGQLLKEQVISFVDSNTQQLMADNNIDGSDLDLAQRIISGKYSPGNMDGLRKIVSMLGNGNSTIRTFDSLIEIFQASQDPSKLSREKAVELLIKVVELLPDTAGAVNSIVLK